MQLSARCLSLLLVPTLLQSTAIAAPPPTSGTPPNSILSQNTPNSTLLNGVIPNDFFIHETAPGDDFSPDPEVAKSQVLLRTIGRLRKLALEDFEAPIPNQKFDLPLFTISIAGVPSSNRLLNKYAIWGIYEAILYMMGRDRYREQTYKLYWQDQLVGQIRFSKSRSTTLSTGDSSNLLNSTSSTSTPNIHPPLNNNPGAHNTTTTSLTFPYRSGPVTGDLRLLGLTLSPDNVIKTVYNAIVAMAPYPRTNHVTEFTSTQEFDIFIGARDPSRTPRTAAPFLTYEALLWALGDLPTEMAANEDNWREARMTLKVGTVLVGVANVVSERGPGVVASS